MPITDWTHYADHQLDPLRRSLTHSEVDEETGFRVRTDNASNEAAKWLIGRGMAKAHDGLIEIVEMPDAWADV